MRSLTVMYDASCPVCRAARLWLMAQRQIVPITFEAAGSAAIARRFGFLDPEQTQRDITVVGIDENGTAHVFTKERAWIVVLWATESWRSKSYWLAQPGREGLARDIASGADHLRRWIGGSRPYSERCGETCDAG